ncbi:OmpW/AlkL family protein [Stakelama marina]|uniref:OmpW family protein n=1 Tax=Stakelama marina TaxID=2826939 RepID=A0A8T4IGD7_9SPHN|nr:OmpW family outer membrane protein [Stakelama marina]MBR0551296.1 OmpW family protein [Stakelama marina]
MRILTATAIATVALGAAAAPAHAQSNGPEVLVRARAIWVSPTERSGPVTPGFPGSEVGVGDSVMPEVDFTLKPTKHIGVELILATTRHEAKGRGTLSGIDTLASTWVLPPTLTLQYHFAPDAKVRPYIGAGVNYTIFYSEHASDALENAIGPTKVSLDDSFGYALQAGTDVDLTDKIFLNFDVKYIDMDTTARLDTNGTINTSRIHIDPLVFGVGVGTRF